MDKKKLIMVGGGIVILIILVIIIYAILPKGNGNTTTTKGYVASVIFAKSEDKNKKPIGQTSVFSVNDVEVHAIITYAGLPQGSNVIYRWYDVKNGIVVKEEKKPALKANYSGISSASLVRDQNTAWDAGAFEFRIVINDVLYFKQSYTVKTESEIQKDQVLAGIKSIQLTTAVDLAGKPSKAVTDVFSKDNENILASVSYDKIPVKINMEARWRYAEDGQLISTYAKYLEGSGTFSFGISASKDSWLPTKKWQVGKYTLEIYIDGDIYKKIEFSVN